MTYKELAQKILAFDEERQNDTAKVFLLWNGECYTVADIFDVEDLITEDLVPGHCVLGIG